MSLTFYGVIILVQSPLLKIWLVLKFHEILRFLNLYGENSCVSLWNISYKYSTRIQLWVFRSTYENFKKNLLTCSFWGNLKVGLFLDQGLLFMLGTPWKREEKSTFALIVLKQSQTSSRGRCVVHLYPDGATWWNVVCLPRFPYLKSIFISSWDCFDATYKRKIAYYERDLHAKNGRGVTRVEALEGENHVPL